MTISVAPATSDWFPAVTQDLLVQVFAEGLVVGQIPTTQIMFTNVLVNPYSDPELNFAIGQALASPSIARGSNIFNTNFGIPALGDQTINYVDTIINTNAVGLVLHDNLWGTPKAGFIYLTHIDVSSIGNSALRVAWTIDSLTSGGTQLYQFEDEVNPNDYITNVRLSAMNVKLDATKTWQMRLAANALGAGNLTKIFTTFVWTDNPN
jgi:hypothetical protein